MTKKTFEVDGMHCQSCNALIADYLGDEDGVAQVVADFTTGTVLVVFDESKITEDKIKSVIKEAGYEVKN